MRGEAKLPQGTIHYRESGEGPPVVFVHGLLVDGRLWRKVTPLLEDRFRCIVPDLPLGSHTTPLNADADLSPPGLARIVADFLRGARARGRHPGRQRHRRRDLADHGREPSGADRPPRAHQLRRVRELPAAGVPAAAVGGKGPAGCSPE